MVRITDKNGTKRAFGEAQGVHISEGVLMLLRSAASAATTANVVAVFAPGAWQSATTIEEKVEEQGSTRTT